MDCLLEYIYYFAPVFCVVTAENYQIKHYVRFIWQGYSEALIISMLRQTDAGSEVFHNVFYSEKQPWIEDLVNKLYDSNIYTMHLSKDFYIKVKPKNNVMQKPSFLLTSLTITHT